MKEATGFTITYGVILFYLNFFFFAVTMLLNVVLLQLKQGSSPWGQLTIAESSDVSRGYYPNYWKSTLKWKSSGSEINIGTMNAPQRATLLERWYHLYYAGKYFFYNGRSIFTSLMDPEEIPTPIKV